MLAELELISVGGFLVLYKFFLIGKSKKCYIAHLCFGKSKTPVTGRRQSWDLLSLIMYIISVSDMFLVDGRDQATSNHNSYFLIQIISFILHLLSAHAPEHEQIVRHASVLRLRLCRKGWAVY